MTFFQTVVGGVGQERVAELDGGGLQSSTNTIPTAAPCLTEDSATPAFVGLKKSTAPCMKWCSRFSCQREVMSTL